MGRRGGKRPGAGRPKGAVAKALEPVKIALSELAQRHAPLALETLAQIAGQGESEAARVSAAVALLDRGFGKPSQSHEVTGKDGGPLAVSGITVEFVGGGE